MAITITSQPSTMGLAKSPLWFTLHTDDNAVERIIVKVFVENTFGSDTYDFGFSFQLTPDNNGDVNFRIEERLKAFLKFALPDLNGTAVQILSGFTKKYKMQYAERKATDLEYIESVYHEDKTASYPHNKIIELTDLIEVGEDYTVIAETSSLIAVQNLVFELSGSTDGIGTEFVEGQEIVQSSTGGMPLAYDSMKLPANVNVRIYKNPVTYTESAVFYTHLGAGSKKVFIPPLMAPTDLVISSPLTAEGVERVDALKIDFTSQSGGLENGFEIEYSTDGGATFLPIVTLSTGVTTYTHTGLNYNTTVHYQVRAVGSSNSTWSNVESGIVSINPLILGASLHAWYRSDFVVFNGIYIVLWTDLSGNGRHLVQNTGNYQPRRGDELQIEASNYNGHYSIIYQYGSGQTKFLDNTTNWEGLGTDDYFVMGATFANTTLGYAAKIEFSRIDNEDSQFIHSAHQLSRTGSSLERFQINHNSESPNNILIQTNPVIRNEFSFDMFSISGGGKGIWYNGVAQNPTYQNTGTIVDSFDTIRFGEPKDLTGDGNRIRHNEWIFGKGNISLSTQKVNDLHEFYAHPRYGGIVNPNL